MNSSGSTICTLHLPRRVTLSVPTNVLTIGSGAREHAIGWKLLQSPGLGKLFFVPGNAGTEKIGTNIPTKMPTLNAEPAVWEKFFRRLLIDCRLLRIDLVVVQNDNALAAGLVDFLDQNGILAFGCSQAAARIESSKVWADKFAQTWGLPKPRSLILNSFEEIRSAELEAMVPCVVKADGLAGGKGVKTCLTVSNVFRQLDLLMNQRILGVSGERIVLQKLVAGREVSAHAFTDGRTVLPLPLSFDSKKSGEGDTGENTGGVGAVSDSKRVTKRETNLINRLSQKIISCLSEEGIIFQGVIYPGLLGAKLIEVNARLGDPETQVLLPPMQGDLLEVMLACVNGNLDQVSVGWSDQVAVCVVLCSRGYPDPEKTEVGFPISGLDSIPDNVLVFHAGTKTDELGRVVTAGGRVLSIVALGDTLEEARAKVYAAIKNIKFEGMWKRDDIGEVK